MPERLTPGQFMLAPKEVRDYMHHMWKIPQSAASEVVDNVQVSDGHTYQDLAVITKELLTEYIGSEESFLHSWEIAVSKAMTELHPPEVMVGAAPVEAPVEAPKKPGRPAKAN